MREIEEKFTLSELVITAWRSREAISKMDLPGDEDREPRGKRKKPRGKFVNQRGEQDLSTATGPEALRAFSSIGLTFPVIGKG